MLLSWFLRHILQYAQHHDPAQLLPYKTNSQVGVAHPFKSISSLVNHVSYCHKGVLRADLWNLAFNITVYLLEKVSRLAIFMIVRTLIRAYHKACVPFRMSSVPCLQNHYIVRTETNQRAIHNLSDNGQHLQGLLILLLLIIGCTMQGILEAGVCSHTRLLFNFADIMF